MCTLPNINSNEYGCLEIPDTLIERNKINNVERITSISIAFQSVTCILTPSVGALPSQFWTAFKL